MLEEIRFQAEELTELVGDLLDLSRIEDAQPEPVALDELVESAVERTRRTAGVDVETQLEPTTIRGVPVRLERAIGNLLDNAAKWSPPGSRVEVLLRQGELTVRDHGPGIDPDDLRGSSTASTAPRGRAASPARGSGSRSCARSWRSTAARSRPRTTRPAARASASACQPPRSRVSRNSQAGVVDCVPTHDSSSSLRGRSLRAAAPVRGDTVLTDGRPRRRRHDGQDRVALPAARLRLPPPRRSTAASGRATTTGTTASCSSRTSATAGSRRWCRSGTTSSCSTRRSSSTRACGRRRATSRASAIRSWTAGPASSASVRTSSSGRSAARSRASTPASTRVRPDRAAAVQPDVRDDDRPRAGVRREGLPPAGDRAGHLHQLQERAPARQAASSVRDRQRRRQVVPERDHSGQLPLSDARVRADGDGVLRPARRVDGLVPLLGAGARRLVPALRAARVGCASASTPPRSCRTTRARRATSSTCSRSAGRSSRGREPRRLRPGRARRALWDEARVCRRGRRALPSPTSSSRR